MNEVEKKLYYCRNKLSCLLCMFYFILGVSSKPVDVPGSVPVIEADGDSGLVASVESNNIIKYHLFETPRRFNSHKFICKLSTTKY